MVQVIPLSSKSTARTDNAVILCHCFIAGSVRSAH
jgi:hypothetical protein